MDCVIFINLPDVLYVSFPVWGDLFYRILAGNNRIDKIDLAWIWSGAAWSGATACAVEVQ